VSAVADRTLENETQALLDEFCQAVSDDLQLLARLHAKELDEAILGTLKRSGFPRCLGLRLTSEGSEEVLAHLQETVEAWPETPDSRLLDLLAADFAAIYLNNSLGASPQESFWLDDEHLVMQRQMFQVREIYERHGLEVENWRTCADDHLVNELEFLARVIAGEGVQDIREVARFLDEHLLRWLDSFAIRIAGRCDTPFYAGLAMLTSLYCEELRNLLALILDEPRPSAEEIEERMAEKPEPIAVPLQYVPGVSPSW